jgi:predicted anti-sigma-YlaC factor YlaD
MLTIRKAASSIPVLLLSALFGGCSVQRLVVNRAADALAGGGAVYARDEDVPLVGSASPFGLKLMESLLAQSPQHRGLLLALARGFTQYSYAYVETPADALEEHDVASAYAARRRAGRLYLRARDYGLRSLAVTHPGIVAALRRDPQAAVKPVQREEIAELYWTAAAWGAAISVNKDDATLVADLPSVQALAARALELDEAFESGAIHVLYISLSMSGTGPEAQRVAAARSHFERAMSLAGAQMVAPLVTFAEAVCVPTAARAQFEELLDQALRIDPGANPDWRLSNTLFQQRAQWLRARTEQLF